MNQLVVCIKIIKNFNHEVKIMLEDKGVEINQEKKDEIKKNKSWCCG